MHPSNLYIVTLPWFCCRKPNPDSVVVVRTPSGIFSGRSFLQNRNECLRGSRLVSSKRVELPEPSTTGSNEFEPYSAAKCHAFKRTNYKVIYLVTFTAFVLLSFPLLCNFHPGQVYLSFLSNRYFLLFGSGLKESQ